MGRRGRGRRASVCHALLAAPALARLPDEAEHARAINCGKQQKFLDFTAWTYPAETLPECTVRCHFRTETVGQGASAAAGDAPACVWRRQSTNGYRLRFGLYYKCMESHCHFLNRWHLYHQMTSLKVAQVLGIPLSEVRSAFLYWVAETWPQTGIPSLEKFSIRRTDEWNTTTSTEPRRRLEDVTPEPWYLLYLSFRVDSARITPRSPGVELLAKNDNVDVERVIGIAAEVQNWEMLPSNVTADEAADMEYRDFQPVFQFEGHEPGLTPDKLLKGEVGGVAGPQHEEKDCLDRCHMVHETGNPLGPYRCADDCDCNGERWCSHMGICVGETLACRTEDLTSTTLRSSSEPDSGGQAGQGSEDGSGAGGGSSGSGGGRGNGGGGGSVPSWPTTTTTEGPLAQLSRGCYETVIGAWQSCTSPNQAGCEDLSCTVVRAAVGASACHEDICASQAFLDRWLDLCRDSSARSSFDRKMRECRVTTTTPPTPEPAVEEQRETIAGSVIWTLLGVMAAALVVCLLMGAVKVLMARHKWPETRLWRGTVRVARSCSAIFSRRNSVVVLPDLEAAKVRRSRTTPPATPPRQPKGDAANRAFKTPPHVPGVSETWSSGKQAREAGKAWTPESASPFPPSSHSRTPWKAHFRRHSAPEVKSPGNGDGEHSDTPDSEKSNDPIGPKKLHKELRQVRKAATKQHLLQFNSPKSLKKELQVQRESVSAEERKRLFKELLLRWHPDKNAGDEVHAAEMFQTLQECKDWFVRDD